MKKTILSLLLVVLLALPAQAFMEKTQDAISVFSEYTGLDLEPYRGKAIFINVFTEWCQYCMMEMPDLRRCFDTYSQEDIVFVLVHPWIQEDESNTASVSQAYGLEGMTIYEDESLAVMNLLSAAGLSGFPHSLVFDKQGEVVWNASGMLELEGMQQLIDEAIGAAIAVEESIAD